MANEFDERYTQENMYPIPNAGKHVTGTGVIRGKQILSVKRRKTCNGYRNLYRARKDMYPVLSAGKHVTGVKSAGNMQLVPKARENM